MLLPRPGGVSAPSAALLLVAALSGCGVPDITFVDLGGTRDATADAAQEAATDASPVDAGDATVDALDEPHDDSGIAGDAELPDSATDAPEEGGCPGTPPPTATTCCGAVACTGCSAAADCTKCLSACTATELCCVKNGNATCHKTGACP